MRKRTTYYAFSLYKTKYVAYYALRAGGVAEWPKAPVLKTGEGLSLPWVRIPPPPAITTNL